MLYSASELGILQAMKYTQHYWFLHCKPWLYNVLFLLLHEKRDNSIVCKKESH